MKKVGIVIVLLLLLTPIFSFAKEAKIKGYSHEKGKEIVANEPLGWSISVSSNNHIDASIESLPDMSVLRIVAYKPWWKLWGGLPATTTISVNGLPSSTSLHIYTRGYREHKEVTTDTNGALELDFQSTPGAQFIIKAKPSTKHVKLGGGLFGGPLGGDCQSIGTWVATSKTCTLTTDVSETIAIEDAGITLEGNGKSVVGTGSGDGIYVDVSNVAVKNIRVNGFARGIAYYDPLLGTPVGGTIQNVVVENSTSQVVIDGVDTVGMDNLTTNGGQVGIRLSNQSGSQLFNSAINKALDAGLYLDNSGGVSISRTDFFNNYVAITGIINGNVTVTRGNFIANVTDIGTYSGNLNLNASDPTRGNYWSKFTSCTQAPAPANPNHCTNSHDTGPASDNLPWACKNAWFPDVTCPRAVTPPPGTGGGTTGSNYGKCLDGGEWAEVVSSDNSVAIRQGADSTSKILKKVPPEWILKLADKTGATMWQVLDVTDNTSGYVPKELLCTNPDREEEFLNKTKLWDKRSEEVNNRRLLFKKAIDNFAGNISTGTNLYSSGGGDGNNKLNIITTHDKFKTSLASILEWETGSRYNYDNRICNTGGDGGTGIMQLTELGGGDPKGAGSGLDIGINDRDNCYGMTGYDAKFYGNSELGIFANFKDGIRVFRQKFSLVDKSVLEAVGDVTVDDLQMISTIYRYNQGSPWKVQLVYDIWSKRTETLKSILETLNKRKVYKDRLAQLPPTWPSSVLNLCSDKTIFEDCLATTTVNKLTRSGFYLREVASKMNTVPVDATFKDVDFAAKLIKTNKSVIIMSLASPAEVQVTNITGKRAGSYGGVTIEDIPNSIYQSETETLSLLYPDAFSTYTIKVKGKTNGTYSFSVIFIENGIVRRFVAFDIPTTVLSTHTYTYDWIAINQGGSGVKVLVDNNDDGVTDSEVVSGSVLFGQDFSKQASSEKVAICHRPQGNPGNSHTLNLPTNAIQAHLAHGDNPGECEKEKDKIKNEEKEVKQESKGDKKDKYKKDKQKRDE